MCIVIIFWYICYHLCRFRNYNTYSASTTERGVFQAIIRKVTLILVFVTLFTLSRFVILVAKLVIASKQPSDNAQVSSVSIYLYWRYIYICIYSEVINVCSTLALARLRYYYCSHPIYHHFNLFLHLFISLLNEYEYIYSLGFLSMAWFGFCFQITCHGPPQASLSAFSCRRTEWSWRERTGEQTHRGKSPVMIASQSTRLSVLTSPAWPVALISFAKNDILMTINKRVDMTRNWQFIIPILRMNEVGISCDDEVSQHS